MSDTNQKPDFVRVTRGDGSRLTNGKIYEVLGFDEDGDPIIHGVVDGNGTYNLFSSDWEPATRAEFEEQADEAATEKVMEKDTRQQSKEELVRRNLNQASTIKSYGKENRRLRLEVNRLTDELDAEKARVSKLEEESLMDEDFAEGREVVYISGPMTGKENFNYDRFEEVEEILTAMGYAVINPAALDEEAGEDPQSGEALTHQEYLRRDIKYITTLADHVVVFDDWWNSRGAVCEAFTAVVSGLGLFALEDDVSVNEVDVARPRQHLSADVELPAPLEALMVVLGARRFDYGHPLDNAEFELSLQNAIKSAKLAEPLDLRDWFAEKIMLKMAREFNAHKGDNIVDIMGYGLCYDMLLREAEYRGVGGPEELLSEGAGFLRQFSVEGAGGEDE